MGELRHVVMFPTMAQGHIIPFLAFADIIQRRHRCTAVTLVSTPLNIRNLRSSLPPDSPLRLADLPFSSADHGLPPGVDNTDALPPVLVPTFYAATRSLQPHFETLLADLIRRHGRHRLCVIADMFLSWTVETAEKLGVFHSVFFTSGAYASAVMFSIFVNDAPAPVPETDPFLVFARRVFRLNSRSRGFLVNTVEEFEKTGVALLSNNPGLPVWAVGPLVRRPSSAAADACIIEWLDSKPPASIIYVSFGSQNSIKRSAMTELATALEASGRPFIWAVRPPIDSDGFTEEWLPRGFEERIRERRQGMVVHGWAPQVEILSHPSAGAFLSHCGWNSVLESLSEGVPIIGWPLMGDQLDNSAMMAAEMGVCVEVARGADADADGLAIGWECLRAAFDEVLGGTEKAKEMRRKAGEIKVMLGRALREEGGSSLKAMEDFLHTAFLEELDCGCESRPAGGGVPTHGSQPQFHLEIGTKQPAQMERS